MDSKSICGIVFRKSIRASYASCDLVMNENDHVIVLIQFEKAKNNDDATSIRSYIRRTLQLGHELTFIGGNWLSETNNNNNNNQSTTTTTTTEKTTKRWEMIWNTRNNNTNNIHCSLERKWELTKCQNIRSIYYPTWEINPPPIKILQPKIKNSNDSSSSSMKQRKQKAYQGQTGHGGGIGKRQQGHVLAEFLLYIIHSTTTTTTTTDDKSNISTFHTDHHNCTMEKKRQASIDYLCQGRGILDIAGGSGHVSMAFSLLRIPSTIIDPRMNVGKLPQRDRKIYKRHIINQKNAVIPYSTYRAWFGTKPPGVDASFREQTSAANNQESSSLPIICPPCSSNNSQDDGMMMEASAVVALHPDEATESIVDVCVQYEKPFVIVPCCVFSRLFPHRSHITTYHQFIDYLQSKHPTIQKTNLENFQGANVALWSTFSKTLI